MCYIIIVTVIQIESEYFSKAKLKSAYLSEANGKLWIDPWELLINLIIFLQRADLWIWPDPIWPGLLFFNELSQHIVDEIVAQQVSLKKK